MGMDKRINALIEIWQKRNIAGFYCEDRLKAAEKIKEFIPESATVGFSGSVTLEELKIIGMLQERGNKIFNPYVAGLSRQESLEIRKQGTLADYYLASANAVSQSGELVFFSAYGNRIAGISDAKNAIIVCGINKISENLNAALKRARYYAAPLNCKRLNWESFCFKEGICREKICNLPEYKRMCCQILIIESEIIPKRLKVILAGEKLGF